jgi:cation diffusion facilitator CzcD-associated flavoprotein CzcO
VLPKEDTPYTEEQLEHFRSDPDAARQLREEIFNFTDAGGAGVFGMIRPQMEEACMGNLAQVEDPALRAKLVPDHPWGCKRPLLSSNYYPTFNRPNLELVTEGIERIAPHAVVTVDGRERPVDTLILATGFAATRYLSVVDVVGRDGLAIADAWKEGAQAYKGVVTAGFPNLFMLYGPNTNGDSIMTTIEYEVAHVIRQLDRLANEDLAWIDVKPESMAQYNAKLQQDLENIEPWQAGCSDYYRAPSGRIVTQWPHRMSDLRRVLETPDLDAYETAPR